MRRGAFIEMMVVEYLDPFDQRRKVHEYERSQPMPTDPPEVETVETRHLFTSGKWSKEVTLSETREILDEIPVGATLMDVREEDHRVIVE